MRLSVLIGECVHNMRSAVDNLVCGLAQIVEPHCKCSELAFPLLADQAAWDKKPGAFLKGIPPAAKEVIRQLQPWADSISPNPLTVLNKLSNIDKHRGCHFMLLYCRNAVFRVHCEDGVIREVRVEEPLYLGEPNCIPLRIDKQLIGDVVRIETSGKPVLTFREESDWDDMPVMQVLQDCFDHIERKVISQLKPFFESQSLL